jgi:hypothetical protein
LDYVFIVNFIVIYLHLFYFLPTENITAKHIVSNDSSDSDDDSQDPKGKRARRSPAGTHEDSIGVLYLVFLISDDEPIQIIMHIYMKMSQ